MRDEVAALRRDTERADDLVERAHRRQLALGIVSVVAGIPVTGIAAPVTGVEGLVVAWLGIAAVNVAHSGAVVGLRRRLDARRDLVDLTGRADRRRR